MRRRDGGGVADRLGRVLIGNFGAVVGTVDLVEQRGQRKDLSRCLGSGVEDVWDNKSNAQGLEGVRQALPEQLSPR